MKLDFTSERRLPPSKLPHLSTYSEVSLRCGIANISQIAIGDVGLFPSNNEFAAKLGVNKSTLGSCGKYAEVLSALSGKRIVRTSGVVGVANFTEVIPLLRFLEIQSVQSEPERIWDFSSGEISMNHKWQARNPVGEKQYRDTLSEMSNVVIGSAAAILPSTHALKEEVGADFKNLYRKNLSYHDVLSIVTGLTIVEAQYIALPDGAALIPASYLLNPVETQVENPAALLAVG